MNILIVDDLLHNCKLLSNILKPYGHCDTADSGQQAVDLFESALEEGTPYDLVLLDIMMPEMDGQEVLKHMRRIEKEYGIEPREETIIIMVTAVDAKTEVEEAFERGGCTDYLNKPVSSGKLLVKLSEHGLIPSDWWKKSNNPPWFHE